MSMRTIPTFFYGSFMNRRVLARAGVQPAAPGRARLDGWDIRIAPRATLVPAENACVYGILGRLAHADLARLYTDDWFGFGKYPPEPVVLVDRNARLVPALCYVAWEMEPGTPAAEYIDTLLETAAEFDFPEWYVQRLRACTPTTAG